MKNHNKTHFSTLIRTYKNFLAIYNQSGKITDENFNKIRHINECLMGKKEFLKEQYGSIFDEIYVFLETPEIKSKLNNLEGKSITQDPRPQDIFAKATAFSIIKSYNKFFKSYKEGDIISNVNVFRLRAISNRLNYKKEQVKEYYGDIFDEIYTFIERPEIVSILLDEKIVIKRKSSNISNSEKLSSIEEKTGNEELGENASQEKKLSLLNTNLSQIEILPQDDVDKYEDWPDNSTSEGIATIIKPLFENDLEKGFLESSSNTLNKNALIKLKNKSIVINLPIKNFEEITIDRENIEFKLDFNPESLTDARERTNRAIVQRQGQSKFRSELLKAYGGQCAITDCDAEAALEAAHIFPYLGTDTNHVTNGLLLRADIHTLFDLHLISIDPDTNKIVISSSLLNTSYKELNGKLLKSPQDYSASPSPQALVRHYETFLLKQNN